MTAWFWISCVLGVIWVIAFISGICFALFSTEEISNSEERKQFLQVFSAGMAGFALFAVAHWILLLLAIPVFLCYGLYNAVKLLRTKPWKEVDTAL